jgi:ParB family transcriptional regulator, chromosome partitioning protein
MSAIDRPVVEYRRLDDLHPNPLNPRGPVEPAEPTLAELAASVRAQGLLQPLLVTPDGTIVAGHRRHAACHLAELTVVPVVVRAMTVDEQLDAMLSENIHRDALSPLEEARAYRAMVERGRIVADIARGLGIHRERVARRLELLQLAPEVSAMFDRYELALTLGRHLLRIQDWPTQRRLATFAARRGLKVASVVALVERSLGAAPVSAPSPRAPESSPPALLDGAARAEVLAALEADHECTVTFGRLARLARKVCDACGMDGAPAICRACPLPQLLAELVRV